MNECLCSKFKWQHFAHKPIKFSMNVNSHSQNIIFIFTLICILLGMMHPITLVHRVLSPAINSIAHILFMSIYLIECLLYNTFHVQFFAVSCNAYAYTVQMPSLSLLFFHFYGHKLKYKELHKFQWVFIGSWVWHSKISWNQNEGQSKYYSIECTQRSASPKTKWIAGKKVYTGSVHFRK